MLGRVGIASLLLAWQSPANEAKVSGPEVIQAPENPQTVRGLKLLTENVTPQGINLVYELMGGRDGELGMTLSPVDPALRTQLKRLRDPWGLLVSAVVPGGPADRVGIKPHDILTDLNTTPLGDSKSLEDALRGAPAGPQDLHLIRAGKVLTLRVQPQKRVTLAPVEAERPSFYLGVQTSPASAALRSHLDLPADSGLVVDEVMPDSPASKSGVKPGDILLKLGNHPLPDAETLTGMIQLSEGKPTELALLREGQAKVIEFTPEPRRIESTRSEREVVYHLGVAPNASPLWTHSYGYGAPAAPHWITAIRPYLAENLPAQPPTNPAAAAAATAELQALGQQVKELRKAVDELKETLKRQRD